jgi:hypothetical protein
MWDGRRILRVSQHTWHPSRVWPIAHLVYPQTQLQLRPTIVIETLRPTAAAASGRPLHLLLLPWLLQGRLEEEEESATTTTSSRQETILATIPQAQFLLLPLTSIIQLLKVTTIVYLQHLTLSPHLHPWCYNNRLWSKNSLMDLRLYKTRRRRPAYPSTDHRLNGWLRRRRREADGRQASRRQTKDKRSNAQEEAKIKPLSNRPPSLRSTGRLMQTFEHFRACGRAGLLHWLINRSVGRFSVW